MICKIYSKRLFLLILVVVSFACAPTSYKKNNRAHKKKVKGVTTAIQEIPKTKAQVKNDTLIVSDEWIGTTNFSVRRPNFVVIHHTAQDSLEQTIRTFTLTRTQVSSHYVIGRDGTVVQMLNDYLRSWHAGSGRWGSTTDLNSSSIGIELDNNGKEPFSSSQIESLLVLLKRLKSTYNIPTANFIGHLDIAPGRKVDPSVYFPWKLLADEGFGLWYDEEVLFPALNPGDMDSSIPVSNEEKPMEDEIDPLIALRIIGYDISNPKAAIQSFKIHFVGKDIDSDLTEYDKKILFNLYKKYL